MTSDINGARRAIATTVASVKILGFTFAVLAFATFTAHASIPPGLSSTGPSIVRSSEAQADAQIRVRLEALKAPFSLSGQSLRFTGAAAREALGYQAVRVTWRSLPSTPASANGVAPLIEWTVTDRDSGALVARFQARKFEASGLGLRMNLKPIPNRVSLSAQNRTARALDLIALLPLEEYVRGVLPAEMPSGWPLEALKAQAIAARTYALYKMHAREESSATFDVETSVMDQVYLLPVRDDMPSEHRANVELAVKETRGLLLSSGGEHPIPLAAYFHADCGGHTEDARTVWGTPSSGTTSDEGCPLNPHAQWQTHLSKAEIALKLHARVALTSLQAVGRTATGRVDRMRLAWADGTSSELSPHDFRMALGHDRVKSTNFQLTASGDGFTLNGKGFGHGVGLCQWGARHLAKAGRSYREILAHYYPRSELIDVATVARTKRMLALNGH